MDAPERGERKVIVSGLLKRCISSFIIAALFAFVFGSCFSPWKGDTGTLLINIGGGSGRALLDIEKEPATLEHEVILRGPGGTITRKFPGTGAVAASFELAAGTWDLVVRAVGDTPPEYYGDVAGDGPVPVEEALFPPRMLRAYGWDTVEIRAGQSNSARVDMYSATEVSNFEQLKKGFEVLPRPDIVREVFLVSGDIKASYYYGSSGFFIDTDWDITFVADETVSITRVDLNDYLFLVLGGGALTLGRSGMRGRLTFDGGETAYPLSIVHILHGELTMNDGVTLRNGSGGAVQVAGGIDFISSEAIFGTFTMNGGTISGSSSNDGGGVYVDEYGIFNMNGGTISGNEANAGTNEGDGGGVFVKYWGSFTKSGGTIYGNEPGINPVLANIAGSGKGHAVFVQGFSGGGSTIITVPDKGRDATAGPGVNLDSGSMLNWDNR